MTSKLIDLETEYQVRLQAPVIGEYSPFDARAMISALTAHSSDENEHMGLDDRVYFRIYLQALMDDLPPSINPKRAGTLCRALCLEMRRYGKGFIVAWTREQLDILRAYFFAEESHHDQ